MVIVNGWYPIRASFADAALLAAVNVFLRKLEQWHRDRNPQHHSESKDKLRRLLMQRVPTEFVPTELVQAELPAIPDKYCSTRRAPLMTPCWQSLRFPHCQVGPPPHRPLGVAARGVRPRR